MSKRPVLPFAHALLLLATVDAAPAAAPAGDVLRALRQGHPRLLLVESDWARLRATVEKEPLAKVWHTLITADAVAMLGQRPIERKLIGPRLLDKSRTALTRVSTLAALYRLGGDKRFAERARKEMLTAAAFSDWNPKHFLDVAEMTTALAIGYDWLFDFLPPEDRAAIRQAIVEKGLKESLPIYARHRWWASAHHNWNQVCNGGMTAGALAVADEEPDLARQIVANAVASVPLAMASYAPDGGWAEGPGYWSYATRYNVFMLAALRSALGTDFGLGRLPGFAAAGLFRIHSVGPLGRAFNFADAGDKASTTFEMLWLAQMFDRPVYAAFERESAAARPNIFHLLWFDGRGGAMRETGLPLDALFRGVNVAFFRGAWGDPAATFVGFKGGDNKANHSHLDLGNFVLDALGQRWALDLGPDDYNLPGFFGKQRWTYYRLRTESHNTLTLDGENQSTSGKAPITAFGSTPERAFAVADLTDGYRAKAARVQRGVALLGRRDVLVQDELEAPQPVEVVWGFLTEAAVKIEGPRAMLTQGGRKLEARILAPADARFEVISANPPKPQRQQPKVRNLTVRLPSKTCEARIAVLLSPGGAAKAAPALTPLASWKCEN